MTVAIQKHLNHSGINWKLVEGNDFVQLRVVLDNVMKERTAKNIGTTRRQAEFIPSSFEDKLWSQGILGEDSPDKLRNTVLFLLGMNVALRAGDEHYDLRRNCESKPSQLQFKRNAAGVKCLVYTEDSITKTNDGGLKSMRKDRKIVWVYPSSDQIKCPVRLVEKYISLCPPVTVKTKKMNFYLRSLEKITPMQWYGEQVVGLNSIRKVTGELLKHVAEGFHSNHSLRRSGTTRLFHKGVDSKLIREFTGHKSDALFAYETTSDEQCQDMSEIIQGQNVPKCKALEIVSNNLEVSVTNKSRAGCLGCACNTKKIPVRDSDQIGKLVENIPQM